MFRGLLEDEERDLGIDPTRSQNRRLQRNK
jgi:hypothetical protein